MLTDAALKCLKQKAKMYKVSDRDGMYVRVAPSGAISFRLDYRLNGRRETVYLGRYSMRALSPISMRWGWKVFSTIWVFLSLSVSWRRFGSVRLLDV